MRIADHINGVDLEVVELFAFFHDSCRLDDNNDPFHGKRAVIYSETLRHDCFSLTDDQFKVFSHACEYHTSGRGREDVTTGVGWIWHELGLHQTRIISVQSMPNVLMSLSGPLIEV